MYQKMIYVPKILQHQDLYLHNYGMEQCAPGHFQGPAIREYHLIHYVLKGEGIFKIHGKTYSLSAGQGFFIPPNVIAYYEADQENPWEYCWIGFHGIQAESILSLSSLSAHSPIFSYNQDEELLEHFRKLISINEFNNQLDGYMINGLLLLLLSKLVKDYQKKDMAEVKRQKNQNYTRNVIDFIEMNFDQKISVTQIANHIGLDRSYLCSIFKKQMNISIQEYLIHFRVNKACTLLANTSLSIGNIARSVGYDDPLLFSKMFKKLKTVSPKEYRNLSFG